MATPHRGQLSGEYGHTTDYGWSDFRLSHAADFLLPLPLAVEGEVYAQITHTKP